MSAEREALDRAIRLTGAPPEWAQNSEPWRTLSNGVGELLALREFRRAVVLAYENFSPSSQPEMDLDELFGAISRGDEKLRALEGQGWLRSARSTD